MRKALTHRMCDPIHDHYEDDDDDEDDDTDGYPTSKQAWDKIKSKKLDVLIKVIEHHLKDDNASPLFIDADGNLVASSEPVPPAPTPPSCDKIVVYSAFPSNNPLIVAVCCLLLHVDLTLTLSL